MNWLKCYQQNPKATHRLICFHHAGGSASVFAQWGKFLRPNIEVIAVQLPGREQRLKDHKLYHIEQIVPEILAELCVYKDKPFAFLGHSMGGMLAFEVTQRLHSQGRTLPIHLFASGADAPHKFSERPHCHQLPDDEFTQHIIDQYDGLPIYIQENSELLALTLPILRADMTVCETYAYQQSPPLPIPITALGGYQDPLVSYDDLLLWEQHTTEPFDVKMFDGDHLFFKTAYDLIFVQIQRVLQSDLG